MWRMARFDSSMEGVPGFVQLSLCVQGDAQMVVRVTVVWVNPDRFAVGPDSFVQFSLLSERIAEVASMGVDGIITNVPDVALDVLR